MTTEELRRGTIVGKNQRTQEREQQHGEGGVEYDW